MVRQRRNTGFTLVEILIVVVILGILAAIVIPQFTNASEDAKSSSLFTQLQTIRSQLELYQVQHNGVYPTEALVTQGTDDWEGMSLKSNVSGTTGTGAGFDYGPYLQQAPRNPLTNSSKISIVTGTTDPATSATGMTVTAAATADVGWVYNPDTGQIAAAAFDEATGAAVTTAPEP